jgi:hypothetical protein
MLLISQILSHFTHFINDWQVLIGAFIGSATALVVVIVDRHLQREKERQDHVHLLHRSIGAALTNLAEIDSTLHTFVDTTLNNVIETIQEREDTPSIGAAFVPLMYVFEISNELLRRFSGSGYIDVKTILLVNRSKDCRYILDDIGRQFLNTQVALSGLNKNHLDFNKGYKLQMENFKSYVDSQIFKNNIPVYTLDLIQAQVAIGHLIDWGPKKWQKTFKNQKIRPDHMVEDIDAYFVREVNSKVDEYQSEFISIIKKTK